MNSFVLEGQMPDLANETFFFGEVHVKNNRITQIVKKDKGAEHNTPFILPGFVDSHVHIESSMLVPSEFARLAVVHGTVATVSDPHEIANVCGSEGVRFMIRNGKTTKFNFNFGAPSCVPATIFETAGATINSSDIESLLADPDILYLSEMMNFPGVINADDEVMKKIAAARHFSKPIDGHAPALRGDALSKYISAGISTDHECYTREEALEKLSLGMKIIIREGSAAKNFDALIDLLHDYPDEMMFCSDDMHPDSLVKGHINLLCERAVNAGIDIFKILKAACINPVLHYGLKHGTLNEGDPANFVVVADVTSFRVLETYINGECVARKGRSLLTGTPTEAINNFKSTTMQANMLQCNAGKHLIDGKIPVIEAFDGQLITQRLLAEPRIVDNQVTGDTDRDILKLVVVNRYEEQPPAIAFIKNFGLKKGAIASSVAHDSHNIIATGVDDASICRAINLVMQEKGGISVTDGKSDSVLALPVAGLMSVEDGYKVAEAYTKADRMAKNNGSSLSAPFMTLSFMALLVIPSLKLSDRGLFDGESFRFVYP